MNRVNFHGSPFPKTFNGYHDAWPGWEFGFGGSGLGVFDARQIYWPDMPQLSAFVARSQAILQAGLASVDLAVLEGTVPGHAPHRQRNARHPGRPRPRGPRLGRHRDPSHQPHSNRGSRLPRLHPHLLPPHHHLWRAVFNPRTKAAAFSLTQSLRMLLAGQGVPVHALLTGPVDTDMVRAAGATSQVTILLGRHPAAHTSLDNPGAVAGLIGALRDAEATSQAAELIERLPAAGQFQLFCEQEGRGEKFRFGRSADGRPAGRWAWTDLG